MATEIDKLQKQLNKKPSMLIEASELMEVMVTKMQVKKVLDVLLQNLRDSEKRVAGLVQATDGEFRKEAQKVKDEFKTTAASITKQFEQVKASIESDARTSQRMLEQRVQDLRNSLPDEYDDSELRSLLEEVKAAIPEVPDSFDPTEIVEELAEHEREIEELKKRPVSTGGGVTNARITQAFKTILKTEAPTGDIDGVNTTYTVSQPIFAVFAFSINGEVIAELPNYTINGNTVEFSEALPAAYSGKDFEVKYI